jgi:hypothetical protein
MAETFPQATKTSSSAFIIRLSTYADAVPVECTLSYLGREHDSGELSLKIDDFGKGHGFTLASEKDPTIANPYKRHIQVPKTLLP